jgi:rfaE bifunctional protein nucleotidyltransferase chain/domain
MGQVISEAELLQKVASDRAKGLKVALANGCFDILHVGHVRYLAGAAAEADRLVVAINDDASVASLKGLGRPLLKASERAELVAAFDVVDYVVIFTTPTVNELIDLVRPEVHCKGTDYTADTVPEHEIVRSYGGRTVIVGDQKNHSTQEILERITKRLSQS